MWCPLPAIRSSSTSRSSHNDRLNSDFRRLWLGQAISAVGTAVTYLALPLTAVVVLGARPQQMGFLISASWLPALLFSLFAGVWADRLRRRPILIATDLARAAVLVTVPLAMFAGVLRIEQLFVVSFLVGSCTVLFQSAYRPYIPYLVGREHLIEANSRIAMADSTARVIGPGLGGVLVQLLTAPIAIAVDVLSYLASALSIWLIRAPETAPEKSERRSVWSEITEGLRFAVSQPFLRAGMVLGAVFNVTITIGDAVYIIYATRVLGLDAGLLGIVLTIGGVAAIGGAAFVGRITRRTGIGPGIVAGMIVLTTGSALPLFAGGPPFVAAAYLAVRAVLVSGAAIVVNVSMTSVGQAATPDRLLGRVGAAGNVVGLGLIPIAALVGGWLGEHVGLWQTLLVSCAGQFVGLIYVVASPLRRIRTTADLLAAARPPSPAAPSSARP
jgi:MFS family permease